jgi:hypothetical protein
VNESKVSQWNERTKSIYTSKSKVNWRTKREMRRKMGRERTLGFDESHRKNVVDHQPTPDDPTKLAISVEISYARR